MYSNKAVRTGRTSCAAPNVATDPSAIPSIAQEQNDQVRRTSQATIDRVREMRSAPLVPKDRPLKIYIAGPFFNVEQTTTIAAVEKACEAAGVPFFSPRLQHKIDPGITQPVPIIGDSKMAQRVFERNYESILACTHMLAVLEYDLPAKQRLAVVEDGAVKKLLMLPDTGTVWEMGVAYALRVPVVGLSLGEHGYMNLMLTQSMVGVVSSGLELREFLEGLKRGQMIVGEWKGSYR